MRKLKTFVTKSGFFEYAAAVPTKKAAMELLQLSEHDFKRHFVSEANDPAIIKTTEAKPGKVLCRSVGTYGKFSEHAKLPKLKASKKLQEPLPKGKKTERKINPNEQKQLTRRNAKAETARKIIEAREEAKQRRIAAVYQRIERHHEKIVRQLEMERQIIEDRLQKEENRWDREKQRFQS